MLKNLLKFRNRRPVNRPRRQSIQTHWTSSGHAEVVEARLLLTTGLVAIAGTTWNVSGADPNSEELRFNYGQEADQLVAKQGQVRTSPILFKAVYTDRDGFGFNDHDFGAIRRKSFQQVLDNLGHKFSASHLGETITIAASFYLLVPVEDPEPGEPSPSTSEPVTLACGEAVSFHEYEVGAMIATSYPAALANHLRKQDLNGDLPEIKVDFNLDIDWHFGDVPTVRESHDFITVAMHEISHGMGFVSAITEGGTFAKGSPTVWDRQLEDVYGLDLVDMKPAVRANAIVSDELYWQGRNGFAGAGGTRPKIHAPAVFKPGSSRSHLDEEVHKNELLSPVYSGVDRDFSPIELGMFADLGWMIQSDDDPVAVRQEYFIQFLPPGKEVALANVFPVLIPDGSEPVTFTIRPTEIIVTHRGILIEQIQSGLSEHLLIAGDGQNNNCIIDLQAVGLRQITVSGGRGNDLIQIKSTTAVAAIPVLISGGDGNDSLTGSVNNELLRGEAGDDTINGQAGHDTLEGGDGKDSLWGGDGNDKIYGQGGDRDALNGGLGNDTLDGGAGNDIVVDSKFLNAKLTNSRLEANGIDSLVSIEAAVLHGDDRNNRIDTSRFVSTWFGCSLKGFGGNDTLIAGNGYDLLQGGDGDDQIFGGAGNDTLRGGDGKDRLDGQDGHDSLIGGMGNDTLNGNAGNDTLAGNEGNDSLDGGIGDDALSGGIGNDRLFGRDGRDTLIGGADNDYMLGGAGNDVALGGDGDDVIDGQTDSDIVAGGSGTNVVAGLPSEINETFVFTAAWIDLV